MTGEHTGQDSAGEDAGRQHAHGGDRLRPGTATTPLRAGLHLRGRRGNLTLEGSTAVPTVWGLLEEPLRSGRLAEFRKGLEPGSAVRTAVDTLLGQLAEHDLLLPAPPPPGTPTPPSHGGSTPRPHAPPTQPPSSPPPAPRSWPTTRPPRPPPPPYGR